MKMKITCSRARIFVFAAWLCVVMTGCGPKSVRTIPDVAMKSQGIRVVALAAPDVKIYEVSAGGVHELNDEWTARGKENVSKAVFANFSGSSIKITPLKPDSEAEQELKEVVSLFEAVSYSITTHTYGDKNPNIFADKVNNFYYSVGSLEALLNKSDANALLLVTGIDEIATGGKVALNVLGTITGAAVGAFTGVALIPRMEGTAMRMALADRNGTILWYNVTVTSTDLRNMDSCIDITEETLKDFPGRHN
jgi:hypothetical protein